MIEKIAEYIQDPNDAPPITFLKEGEGLEKTASYGGEIQKFLDNLEREEGKIYALVNALTAGEYYGPNRNGDYFPEKALKERHHTFVEKGHVYKHHCFVSGTKVVDDSYVRRPIETFKEGDYVITHEGRRRVSKVYKHFYEGPGVELTIKGIPTKLKTTQDHPILVFERDQIHCQHKYNRLSEQKGCGCATFQDKIGDPVWKDAADVKRGDYVVDIIPEPGYKKVSPEVAELIGWVASEGYLGKKGIIQFSFSKDNISDISKVTKCLTDNGLHVTVTPRPQYNIIMLSSCSKKLSKLLSFYIKGVKSNKRLTSKVLDLDTQSKLIVLGAYIDGDGSVCPEGLKNNGILRIRSSSKQMLYILSDILKSLKIPNTVNYDAPPGPMVSPTNKKTYIGNSSGVVMVNKTFAKEACVYSRKLSDCVLQKHSSRGIIDNYSLHRVQSVNSINISEDVFNLEVEEANTYIAGGILVHNCNKNPEKAMGKVIFSHYNDEMKRVEVVVSLKGDHPDVLKIIKDMIDGKLIKTSMGCFRAGTPVTLPNGSTKPIETLKVGDEVRTHLGNVKKVTKLEPRPYSGKLITLKTSGKYTEDLECTEEHPIYVFKKSSFSEDLSLKDGEWVKAEDVEMGDYLISPKEAGSPTGGVQLSDCMAYIVKELEEAFFKGAVFNFEVEDDNSYLVNNGYAVHNCRVPEDVCSITKKKAKTRAQYSDYLKYRMNETLPDGRRVYAENWKPTFFDLSIVTIPADPVSGFMVPIGMDKIAEAHAEKTSTIKKQIGAELDFLSEDPKSLILKSTEKLPQEKIEKLAEYPLGDTLSTFLALRILPTREDFQKLAFYSMGKKQLADSLESSGNIFEVDITQDVDLPKDIKLDNAQEKIANHFSEDLHKFSLTKPTIIHRIIEKKAYLNEEKTLPYPNISQSTPSTLKSFFKDDSPQPAESGVSNPIPSFMALGTLYAGYARLFGESAAASEFTTFMGRNPWLGPLVGGAIGLGITKMQEDVLDPVNKELYKTSSYAARGGKAAGGVEKFLGTFLVAAPASYYQSAKSEEKARRGQPLSQGEDFIRKNPFLTALGGTVAARSIAKTFRNSMDRRKYRVASSVKNKPFPGREKTAFDNSFSTETISLIYKELIS